MSARISRPKPTPRVEEIPISNIPLTHREQQITKLIIGGYKNKEIAWLLGVQCSTVETLIQRIMEKLHARDRVDIVRRGFFYLLMK